MPLRAKGDINFSRHFHWLRSPLSTQVANDNSGKKNFLKMKEKSSRVCDAKFHAASPLCTGPDMALVVCSSTSGGKENEEGRL